MSLKSKRILLFAEANGVGWPDFPAINALCIKCICIESEVEGPLLLSNTATDLGRGGLLMI
jgi:hypothetical protein